MRHADGNLTSRSDGAVLTYDEDNRLVGFSLGATAAGRAGGRKRMGEAPLRSRAVMRCPWMVACWAVSEWSDVGRGLAFLTVNRRRKGGTVLPPHCDGAGSCSVGGSACSTRPSAKWV